VKLSGFLPRFTCEKCLWNKALPSSRKDNTMYPVLLFWHEQTGIIIFSQILQSGMAAMNVILIFKYDWASVGFVRWVQSCTIEAQIVYHDLQWETEVPANSFEGWTASTQISLSSSFTRHLAIVRPGPSCPQKLWMLLRTTHLTKLPVPVIRLWTFIFLPGIPN
jgi:hypothetical protein